MIGKEHKMDFFGAASQNEFTPEQKSGEKKLTGFSLARLCVPFCPSSPSARACLPSPSDVWVSYSSFSPAEKINL